MLSSVAPESVLVVTTMLMALMIIKVVISEIRCISYFIFYAFVHFLTFLYPIVYAITHSR